MDLEGQSTSGEGVTERYSGGKLHRQSSGGSAKVRETRVLGEARDDARREETRSRGGAVLSLIGWRISGCSAAAAAGEASLPRSSSLHPYTHPSSLDATIGPIPRSSFQVLRGKASDAHIMLRATQRDSRHASLALQSLASSRGLTLTRLPACIACYESHGTRGPHERRSEVRVAAASPEDRQARLLGKRVSRD